MEEAEIIPPAHVPLDEQALAARPATLQPVLGEDGEISEAEAVWFVDEWLRSLENAPVETFAEFFGPIVDFKEQGIVRREEVAEAHQKLQEEWPQRDWRLIGKVEVIKNFGDAASIRFRAQHTYKRGKRTNSGRTENILLVRRMDDGEVRVIGIRNRRI